MPTDEVYEAYGQALISELMKAAVHVYYGRCIECCAKIAQRRRVVCAECLKKPEYRNLREGG